MTETERFAFAALLNEMRVFFHIRDLALDDYAQWFERNHREFADLACTFEETYCVGARERLDEIHDRDATMTSYKMGYRTRAERLGDA